MWPQALNLTYLMKNNSDFHMDMCLNTKEPPVGVCVLICMNKTSGSWTTFLATWRQLHTDSFQEWG